MHRPPQPQGLTTFQVLLLAGMWQLTVVVAVAAGLWWAQPNASEAVVAAASAESESSREYAARLRELESENRTLKSELADLNRDRERISREFLRSAVTGMLSNIAERRGSREPGKTLDSIRDASQRLAEARKRLGPMGELSEEERAEKIDALRSELSSLAENGEFDRLRDAAAPLLSNFEGEGFSGDRLAELGYLLEELEARLGPNGFAALAPLSGLLDDTGGVGGALGQLGGLGSGLGGLGGLGGQLAPLLESLAQLGQLSEDFGPILDGLGDGGFGDEDRARRLALMFLTILLGPPGARAVDSIHAQSNARS